METHLVILGVTASLTAPTDLLRPIAAAYRRFAVPDPAPRPDVRVALASKNAGSIRVDDRDVPRIEQLDLTLQIYRQFLMALFDRIDRYAILHAAALTDPSGNGFLLAAPTGHGKSSLTLALVGRGRGFLSDDYAPLDLAKREIHPYPRAVGVVPGGSADISPRIREMVEERSTTRLFDKGLVDVDQALGQPCIARHAAPLRNVILLDSATSAERDRAAVTSIQAIVKVDEAERIERELSQIDGVELLQKRTLGCTRSYTFLLHPEERPTRDVSRILDDESIIFSERLPRSRPDFSASPVAIPIKRREAAVYLCREMLNRRQGGRLLARYDNNPTGLFLDVAAALGDSRCFRLSVGDFQATVELIDDLISPRRDRGFESSSGPFS